MKQLERLIENKYYLKLHSQIHRFKSLNKKYQVVIIFFLLLFLLGIPGVLAFNKMQSQSEEVVEVEEVVESTPTPTIQEEPTPTKKAVYLSPTITKSVTSIKTPTPTVTSANNPTSAPTQTSDTTAPTLNFMTGPSDGSTIDSANFCFPMMASDNKTRADSIQTRYRFDSPSFGDWGNNLAPCFSNVANGSHNFVFEFRDEAGNVGSPVNRTFTVQVN